MLRAGTGAAGSCCGRSARHSRFPVHILVPDLSKDCLFVSMGPGTLCKSSKEDLSLDGGGTATVHPIGPQGACEKFCQDDGSCTGYEYRAIEERCEIWHIPIRYARQA